MRLWTRRVGWFVVIWAASVAALGMFAALFRLAMHAAGLTG
jgi:hypothetical protein